MSTVERNKGKLIPVTESVTDLAERLVKEIPKYCSSKEEAFMDDPSEYGYVTIRGDYYKVKWEIEGEKDCSYFADVKKTKKGIIKFHTLHYNGGGHWTEIVEDAMKGD